MQDCTWCHYKKTVALALAHDCEDFRQQSGDHEDASINLIKSNLLVTHTRHSRMHHNNKIQ